MNKLTKEQQNWVGYLATDPPKTRGILGCRTKDAPGCCLGYACVSLDGRVALSNDCNMEFDPDNTELPSWAASKLGISNDGKFKPEAKSVVDKWLTENDIELRGIPNLTCLINVNDQTHCTHAQISLLIKELFEKGLFCEP